MQLLRIVNAKFGYFQPFLATFAVLCTLVLQAYKSPNLGK